MQYTASQLPIPAALLLTKVELWHHLTADFPDLQATGMTALRRITRPFPAIHNQNSSAEVTGSWIVCGRRYIQNTMPTAPSKPTCLGFAATSSCVDMQPES